MKTEEILTALRSRGAYVRLLEGQRLGVEPASVLTDDLRAEIRAHKTELIHALREEDGPLGAASALEVRQEIGAVLIASPQFGMVWVALDPSTAAQLVAEEQLRAKPRPVLTAKDLAQLEGRPAVMISAMLATIAAFPGARVVQ